MRIIGGKWRGRRLAQLGGGDPKAHLRPTIDRVRQSLFNILEHGAFAGHVENAVVLDLFAGTGALGLEALSRGARMVGFVDNGAKAQGLLRENIALCRAEDMCTTWRVDALRLPKSAGFAADLVFADPPYGKGLAMRALAVAAKQNWLARGALVIVEENRALPEADGFDLLETRGFGDSCFTFLRFCAGERVSGND